MDDPKPEPSRRVSDAPSRSASIVAEEKHAAPALGSRVARRPLLSVEVATLPQDERQRYKTIPHNVHTPPRSPGKQPVESQEHGPPTRVLGEQYIGTDRFIYTLHDDEIIRRFAHRDFQILHRSLMDEYEMAKDDGTLDDFDLDDPRIASPVKPHASGRTTRIEYRDTTSESSLTESEMESDGYGELEDSPVATKRSTRATANASSHGRSKPKTTFSPRKLRTSGRNHKAVMYDDDNEASNTDKSSESGFGSTVKKAPKIRNKVASRPAYGNIRSVDDLDVEDAQNDPMHTHRATCEKCAKKPAHKLLAAFRKNKPSGKRRRRSSDDDSDESLDGEGKFEYLGGWVRCLKCCVVAHWKCLAGVQRDEILRAARQKESELGEAPTERRRSLTLSETTEFVCGSCSKGGSCMMCREVALEKFEPQAQATAAPPCAESSTDATSGNATHPMDIDALDAAKSSTVAISAVAAPADTTLLFRCTMCKRIAHYEHLVHPDAEDVEEIARFYQMDQAWACGDCASYVYPLEVILAWRPYPKDASEALRGPGEPPNYKSHLPREYLVKWVGRSYHRVEWVPHMWLLSTNSMKLKNFVEHGPKVHLKVDPHSSANASNHTSSRSTPMLGDHALGIDQPEADADDSDELEEGPPAPCADAESRIPHAWTTIDRVLDVRLWCLPTPAKKKVAKQSKGRRTRVESDDDEDDSGNDEPQSLRVDTFASAREDGREPETKLMQTVAAWERREGRKLTVNDIDLVLWAYMKWDDMTYEQATFDAPPERGTPGFADFERGFERFLAARDVLVPQKRGKQDAPRKEKDFVPLDGQPDLGQEDGLALRDFQVDGVTWLYFNWWKHRSSILADEMGLGKTVQMTTLLGMLCEQHEAFPSLVVVPNSTLINWLREFQRWAPRLRVVPFYGEAKSREIIKKYELFHETQQKGYTAAKFHVLLTTYEAFTNVKDGFALFQSVKRWEVIVIDEGQRIKSDSSLLFRRLKELHSQHRILMTGTPLNNNIRELFNLMNFLDPDEWDDLVGLETRYAVLDDELVAELHEKLKPYFLRRTKADVLTLPPKNEVIVPVTMTNLQKSVYKSILGQNLQLLGSLLQTKNSSTKIGKMNNILMQLRKCLQHPYLVNPELEPRNVSAKETQRNLIDASAKLRLLHIMLPRLMARGHRILIFSQFKIALDIIEDFLKAENITFRRLDGGTKQVDRQKAMDDFNRPDSDVSVFILTTRAGGVGINLYTADTVIIFDPDFNPHQDLQAIARSHRFGQTKTVLVFKLMVKATAEERIVQTGKKKLALDHLIVQTLNEDDGRNDNVQSLLTFGAKALFDEDANAMEEGITYSEQNVDELILRTEAVGDEVQETKKSALAFDFTKIWLPQKGTLGEVAEDLLPTSDAPGDQDFWATVVARADEEASRAVAAEQTGRGARRRAAVNYAVDPESPEKPHKRSKHSTPNSDDERDVDFAMSDAGSEFSEATAGLPSRGVSEDLPSEVATTLPPVHLLQPIQANRPPIPGTSRFQVNISQDGTAANHTAHVKKRRLEEHEKSDVENGGRLCGLCGVRHPDQQCYAVTKPDNLLVYRKMLLDGESDEPYQQRMDAIRAIDEKLHKLGLAGLLRKLPKIPPEHPQPAEPKKKRQRKDKVDAFQLMAAGAKAHSVKSVASGAAAESSNAALATVALHALPSAGTSNLSSGTAGDRTDRCVICSGPAHLGNAVKQCPLVRAGPESIRQAIVRLQLFPQHAAIVNRLRKIFEKHSEAEAAARLAQAASREAERRREERAKPIEVSD